MFEITNCVGSGGGGGGGHLGYLGDFKRRHTASTCLSTFDDVDNTPGHSLSHFPSTTSAPSYVSCSSSNRAINAGGLKSATNSSSGANLNLSNPANYHVQVKLRDIINEPSTTTNANNTSGPSSIFASHDRNHPSSSTSSITLDDWDTGNGCLNGSGGGEGVNCPNSSSNKSSTNNGNVDNVSGLASINLEFSASGRTTCNSPSFHLHHFHRHYHHHPHNHPPPTTSAGHPTSNNVDSNLDGHHQLPIAHATNATSSLYLSVSAAVVSTSGHHSPHPRASSPSSSPPTSTTNNKMVNEIIRMSPDTSCNVYPISERYQGPSAFSNVSTNNGPSCLMSSNVNNVNGIAFSQQLSTSSPTSSTTSLMHHHNNNNNNGKINDGTHSNLSANSRASNSPCNSSSNSRRDNSTDKQRHSFGKNK